MDATVASLIGAAIGALSGLAGGFLTGRRQNNMEREKWLRSRRDEQQKTLRLAVAELTKKLAVGTHTIAWLTWKATYTPTQLMKEDLLNYHRDMRALFPEIVGSRAVVIALDEAAHRKISPFIVKLFSLDAQIAEASVSFENARQDCIAALTRYYAADLELDEELLTTISEVMGLDETIE